MIPPTTSSIRVIACGLVLDTVLARADAETQERFVRSLANAPGSDIDLSMIGYSTVDTVSWEEDLERALVCVGQQEFGFADSLLTRWLSRCSRTELTGVPRRAAQMELALAVVAEMSGRWDAAARRYSLLASDQ